MNYYFITGTSSGIGKALAENLLLDENNVVFGFSRRNFIENHRFHHHSIDLSDLNDVKMLSFPELKDVKKVVLINNAGTLGEIKYLGNLAAQDIITTLNVNISAASLIINQFIQQFQTEKTEKIIINISSGAATKAYDGWAVYCASKAALNMLTEAIAEEQKEKEFPIKTYAIAPGVVDTFMQDTIRNTEQKDFQHIEKFVLLKNQGALYDAHDVANVLISYCNDTSKIPSLISRIEL